MAPASARPARSSGLSSGLKARAPGVLPQRLAAALIEEEPVSGEMKDAATRRELLERRLTRRRTGQLERVDTRSRTALAADVRRAPERTDGAGLAIGVGQRLEGRRVKTLRS